MTIDYKLLGQRLRKARKEARYSQKELGEKTGCSGTTICWTELAKYKPRLSILESIANALNKPIGYFIGEEKQEPETQDSVTRLDRIEKALEKLLAKEEGEHEEPKEEKKEKVYHVGDKFLNTKQTLNPEDNLYVIAANSDGYIGGKVKFRLVSILRGHQWDGDGFLERDTAEGLTLTEKEFSKICASDEKAFKQVYGEFILKE